MVVTRRISSDHVVGRRAELSRVDVALDSLRAGTVRPLLVGGEAGIGKSRLVGELVAGARDRDVLVLGGGCVAHGGRPLQPLVEMLEALTSDPAGAPAALDGAALPDLIDGVADGSGRDGPDPGAVQRSVAELLDRLVERGPVVVVIEDLHWADQSTRELFAAVARSHGRRLLLVGTYRADELDRGHPLLSLLAELERSAAPERVQLAPLGRRDVGRLVEAITGSHPGPAAVDRLLAHSGGNPFFVEELLAIGDHGGLPESLREVVMARAGGLDAAAMRTLATAALVTPPVPDPVLLAGSGLDEAAHRDAVAAIAARNLLVADGTTWRFRHELVRDVFAERLLPGDRASTHRALADALAETVPSRLGEIARHRAGAGQSAAALRAAVGAGDQAAAVGAMAEAVGHWERALKAWDDVPDEDEQAGVSRSALLVRASAAAARARDFDHAVVLARQAVDQADEAVSEGLAWEQLADAMWHAGEPGMDDAIRAALELVPGSPPSAARARIEGRAAQRAFGRGEPAACRTHAEAAIALGRAVGAVAETARGHLALGSLMLSTGDVDGVEELHRALEISVEGGASREAGSAVVNLTHGLLMMGEWSQLLATHERHAEVVAAPGVDAIAGVIEDFNLLAALEMLGDWDRAEEVVTGLFRRHGQDSISRWDAGLAQGWGLVLVARGDRDRARTLLSRSLTDARQGYISGVLGPALTGLVELDGASEVHLDDIDDALEQLLPMETIDAVRLVAAAIRHLVAGPGGGVGMDDDLDRAAHWVARIDQAVAERWQGVPPGLAAWRAQVGVELAGASGDPAMPRRWHDQARRWAGLGCPYQEAMAWYRLAVARLTSSPGRDARARRDATGQLRRARELAEGLRATRLVADIDDLAQRARITLAEVSHEGGADEEPAPFGLTPREKEVLALVAAGRSNGQIGEELFISPKTASVHVSNILRKLGATNRIEAAAIAVDTGVTAR